MILQGRLVRDPELSTTPSGVEVAKFTVAWSEKYKETETKCFLNCVAWRQNGVFINNYFRKGQEILVDGQLTTRTYQDKDGNNRTVTELSVSKAHFCGSKKYGQGQQTQSQPQQPTVNTDDFEPLDTSNENDLPF